MKVSISVSRKGKGLGAIKNAKKRCRAKIGFPNNPEMSAIATYNEFGWVQRVTPAQATYLSGRLGYDTIRLGFDKAPVKPNSTLSSPPRPFLRGTLRAQADTWKTEVGKGIKALGLKGLQTVMQSVGGAAATDVRETIKKGGTRLEQFKERSDLTMLLYSAQDSFTQGGNKRKIERDSGDGTRKPLRRSSAMLNAVGFEVE